MAARKQSRPTRRGWRGWAILAACLAGMAAMGYWIKSALVPRAVAQSAAPAAPLNVPAPLPAPSNSAVEDYSRRMVAYLSESEPVSREQLGEYLIERYSDKIELLLNKRIIDDACRQYGVEVSAGEIEAALAEELEGLAVNQTTFVNTLLARYHKNLYEWKEDIIRPKLLLSKLCRNRAHVSEEDVRNAFESVYGEKIEAQIILWPNTEKGRADALADYVHLRDDSEAFDRKAKAQFVKRELAATAGKVRPFGRHVMGDDNFDRIVFRLQPGEISEVIPTIDGPVVVKCLKRVPADTTINLEAVREKLVRQIIDKQVVAAMQKEMVALKEKAHPKILLQKKNKADDPDVPPPADGSPRWRQVVAVYNEQTPITREDLGEFLIDRYGAQKVEFLVNRLLIEKECKTHGITVAPQEIEEGLNKYLKRMNMDLKVFEKEYLAPNNLNIYEWREDVIRPELLLTKLCKGRVKVTDGELKMAYDAHFGERLTGWMIVWPAEQTRYALMEYTQIRDNPAVFEEKAKRQASGSLAAKGGRIGPFGRHTLGNDEVEREAFKLQPGEMTTLIGTPEGHVVFKLDKRLPPETSITLGSKRAELTQEVFEKKMQHEMQTFFHDLRLKCNPRVMLKDPNKPIDLAGATKQLLSDKPANARERGKSRP